MESDPITEGESIVRHARADASWAMFVDTLEELVHDQEARDVLQDLAITAVMFHELAAAEHLGADGSAIVNLMERRLD